MNARRPHVLSIVLIGLIASPMLALPVAQSQGRGQGARYLSTMTCGV